MARPGSINFHEAIREIHGRVLHRLRPRSARSVTPFPGLLESVMRANPGLMSTTSRTAEFLDGGGGVGALMRAHDWSQSPLGPPKSWPQPLRTTVELILQSRFPMFVAWGDELGFLYNDPYAEILGSKHPRALGRRFDEIWAEIWADISPL